MYKYLSIFLASFILLGCDNAANKAKAPEISANLPVDIHMTSDADNAQTALDYIGDYAGRLPVHQQLVTVALSLDKDTYIYHSGEIAITGHYLWNKQGNIIHLQDQAGQCWLSLFVAENRLFAVDDDNQWIVDEQNQPYALIKQ